MKKTYVVALLVFVLGAIMLLGSSYSLIVGNLVSDETYSFDVANFNVQFLDNKEISIGGIPEDDESALKNSKEFSFTVSNNSDYDVNYRLDIIENNSLNMSKVIHYVYRVNDDGYSEVLNLGEYPTINQNKTLKVNAKDTYYIKMWLSIDADEAVMNKTFSASISLVATQNEYKYATTVIEKLAKNNQDSLVISNNSYRYLKGDSNYLWFNCQDGFTKGEDYCEKWQIIGSFKNKKEKARNEYMMLKIINTKAMENVAFNNSEKTGDYDDSYIETFANGSYYDKLSEEAKKYIMRAKWNIGTTKGSGYSEALNSEIKKSYYGNIGLANVSDYLFIVKDSFIKENNMMFINKYDDNVNVLKETLTLEKSTNTYAFVPCVYLRPDVSIISGDGSFNSPYEITIKYPMNY